MITKNRILCIIVSCSLFLSTAIFAQTSGTQELKEITKNSSIGAFVDSPLMNFYISDEDEYAMYDTSVVYTLGLFLNIKDVAIDFSFMYLYNKEYEDAKSSMGDINFYYTNNRFLNHFRYKQSMGHYNDETDDYYEDVDTQYFPDSEVASFQNRLSYQLLGKVSLRNIYLHNEYQPETRAGLLLRLDLDSHLVRTNEGKEIEIPDKKTIRIEDSNSLEKMTALSAAPMVSGIVNFRFLMDNLNLALGLAAGPNFTHAYHINSSEDVTSITPKFDLLFGMTSLTDTYFVSVLADLEYYATGLDSDTIFEQIDFKNKLIIGVRF